MRQTSWPYRSGARWGSRASAARPQVSPVSITVATCARHLMGPAPTEPRLRPGNETGQANRAANRARRPRTTSVGVTRDAALLEPRECLEEIVLCVDQPPVVGSGAAAVTQHPRRRRVPGRDRREIAIDQSPDDALAFRP